MGYNHVHEYDGTCDHICALLTHMSMYADMTRYAMI